MDAMKGMSLRRGNRNRAVDIRGPLRVREPRGLISPEHATSLLAPFTGALIGACDTSMDRLVVAIATDPMHLIVIAGPLLLAPAEGTKGAAVSVCHLPGSPQAVEAVDALSGRQIESVSVNRGGDLHLAYEGGSMTVRADAAYEAWEVRGMDGGLLACLPGGAISLWTPTADLPASAAS